MSQAEEPVEPARPDERSEGEPPPTALGVRVVKALLLLAVAAGPVVLYDRLVARELLEQSRRRGVVAPEAVVDEYHKVFYSQPTTWNASRWLGITAWQNPNDVWITQEIIFDVKPDVIVEAGTAFGGSAVIWAMVLEQVNPEGRVVTIDIESLVDEATLPPVAKRMVDFLVGSSTDPAIVAEVRRRTEGKSVLVLLDSDHSQAHVAAELRAYAPMVGMGGYVIVQDTNVNGHPVRPDFGPGPWEAVDEFLATDPRFVADRSRERLLLTFCPRGYLKRVS